MDPSDDTVAPADTSSPSTVVARSRHIYLLPNLLTTLGLFSGFYAILAAASDHFEHACVAVFVAAVFDGVDGRVARLTGTSSEFGVQFDSLADLVSFGMAPALVMYHWSLSSMRADGTFAAKLGWAAAFLYVATALTIACALLMVSRIRYTSFKGEKSKERVPFWVMLLIVGFLVALMIDPSRVLLAAAAAYALSGPLHWLWNKLRRK